MGLKRNLRTIFDRSPNHTHRYRARGFDGPGSGWGVWDMREERYLKNREIARLSARDIDEIYFDH